MRLHIVMNEWPELESETGMFNGRVWVMSCRSKPCRRSSEFRDSYHPNVIRASLRRTSRLLKSTITMHIHDMPTSWTRKDVGCYGIWSVSLEH